MNLCRCQGNVFHGGGGGKTGKQTAIKEDFEIAIHTFFSRRPSWQELMGNNQAFSHATERGKAKLKDIKDEELKQFPVEDVSWDDAQEFIKKAEREGEG